MRTTHLRVSLYVAALYLCAISLQAQSVSSTQNNPPLITSMSLEAFQQRVQALGFSPERGNTDGKPDAFFIFMAEGRKVGALTLGPAVIELFVSYKDGATLEDLNDWNRTHFGATAFVAQNGSAMLRSELVLEGGVTEQNVSSFITRFRDMAVAYARFILDHKKKPQAAPGE